MHLHEIQVRRPEPRLLVDLTCGVDRHLGGSDDRTHEEVTASVALALQRRGDHPDDRAARAEPADDFRPADDRRSGAIADRAGHHRRERPGDHARAEHLLGRDGRLRLALAHRVLRPVVPVLRRDRREMNRLGAPLVHATRRPHGEEPRREDGILQEGWIRPARALLDHGGHLVEAERQDDVVPPARHRQAGLPEGGRARGRRVLDPLDREPREAELLHHPNAAHDRREDVADVGRLDVAEGEPRVLERGESRREPQVGIAAVGPHAEAMHADSEDGDVLHHFVPTGRKRTMTTSCSPSSRIGSSSASSVIPMR